MAKKRTANTVGLLILLLLVMGLAGIGMRNFGGTVSSVATVGSTEISVDDYARAVQAQLRSLQQSTGQQLTYAQARALGMDSMVMSQLVSAAAIEDETAKLGISVGDQRVAQEIAKVSAFQGANGQFDRTSYEMVLKNSGLNPADYEKRVRAELSASLVRNAVGSGVETPPVFVDTIYQFARETRDATWARLTAADLATPLTPATKADLKAYYDANPNAYTRPETKLIDYAEVTPEMLTGSVTLDEAELKTLYDAEAAKYVQPERRLVERLGFANLKDAQTAMDDIDAGKTTFDQLVADRGLKPSDVDLGDVTEASLGKAGPPVFALKDPGVLGPLPSSVGPALFRMNGILAGKTVSFEEAKPDLVKQAAAQKAARMISDEIPKIQDMLAGGADLKTLTDRTDLKAGHIDWNTDVTDGIAADQSFVAAASAAKVGDFPKVEEMKGGGVFVLWVTKVEPPAVRPFDEVKDKVTADWTREATGKALTAQAEALAEKLRGGAEMAGLHLTLGSQRGIGRGAAVDGTPPDFVTSVFDMKEGDIKVLSSDGEAWLVRLDAVHKPDPMAPDSQVEMTQVASQTSAAISNSLITTFTRAVLDQTGVQINQAALNAVDAQLK